MSFYCDDSHRCDPHFKFSYRFHPNRPRMGNLLAARWSLRGGYHDICFCIPFFLRRARVALTRKSEPQPPMVHEQAESSEVGAPVEEVEWWKKPIARNSSSHNDGNAHADTREGERHGKLGFLPKHTGCHNAGQWTRFAENRSRVYDVNRLRWGKFIILNFLSQRSSREKTLIDTAASAQSNARSSELWISLALKSNDTRCVGEIEGLVEPRRDVFILVLVFVG